MTGANNSDKTLQLLGKAISYEVMSQTDTLTLNPKPENLYNILRIGLSDYILNNAPFLDTGWFKHKFIEVFGNPEYILTQCGIYFSTTLFLKFIFKTLVYAYKTFIATKLLKGQITFWSALSHGFLGTVSKSMINAVESDNDSDDKNTNTNPTKIKTSPSRKSFSHYSSIKISHVPKFKKSKEKTQLTPTSTSAIKIIPTSLNNLSELPITNPPYSVTPNPLSSIPIKIDSLNTSSKNDLINPPSNS